MRDILGIGKESGVCERIVGQRLVSDLRVRCYSGTDNVFLGDTVEACTRESFPARRHIKSGDLAIFQFLVAWQTVEGISDVLDMPL